MDKKWPAWKTGGLFFRTKDSKIKEDDPKGAPDGKSQMILTLEDSF